jgi:LemA protein
MKASQILMGIVLLLVLAAIFGGGCIYQGYNQAIGLDESANQTWAEVDNQLKRRNDLVPELVETVKGVAGQEQTVFLGIAEARKAYFQAKSVDEKEAAGRQMDSALSRLLLLQEQYPQLKSNESFLKLQDSLEGTENRLVVARQRYNQTVQQLNAYVRQFPGRFFAALAGVEKRTYFETPADERKAPKVDFSELRKKDKEKE